MTKQDIFDQGVRFMVDELEIDEQLISEDARLKEDLGIDSLEIVDVVVYVDETFGFRMKPADFKEIATVAQFCQFIEEHLA